jgi:lipoyl(octanoyl) transferase
VAPDRFPVFKSGRGGQYTYHGPGQRVAYVMLDLKRRGADVRAFVAGLEQWIIDTLDQFNVKGERREDRVGGGGHARGQDYAIGIRVRHWVTFHGIPSMSNPI